MEANVLQPTAVGLDLAKTVFQIHAVDTEGRTLRKKLHRSEVLKFFGSLSPCLVGIEACPTAHHWAREIAAQGHDVRLMPAAYVKAYLRRQKNDAADAEAICEAVTRPTMRFVPVKTSDQQAMLVVHRIRELLVRQSNKLINALRGHCAEFGVIAPQGARKIGELIRQLRAGAAGPIPEIACGVLLILGDQLSGIATEIRRLDRKILAWVRQDQTGRRLMTIPGIGPITASAMLASVSDPALFKSGKAFAAYLGLVPRQYSSGGKDKLGRISKRGDGYLRWLLVVGAVHVVRRSKVGDRPGAGWIRSLLDRRPAKVVAVAQANKTARHVWALLARGGEYDAAMAARG